MNVESNQQITQPNRPQKKAGWPRQYVVIVMVALGISLLLSPPTFKTERAVGSTVAEGVPEIETASRLSVKLAQTLGEGEFQVSAKDMETGKVYRFGPEKTFDAASTMKLLFAAFMYHQAEVGAIDLDKTITIPNGEIQRYGTGVIQNQPGSYRGTYRELTRLMMEKSDNTAAYILARDLGNQKLQDFAESLGMHQTTIETNTTTPDDMLKLLEAIHRNQIASPEQTKELRSILDDSDFEDRLPAKLPEGAIVHHKTGDAFGGGLHDVGLVEYNGHTYAVAIFTDRQGADQENTKARMADASRDIFAYFNRER